MHTSDEGKTDLHNVGDLDVSSHQAEPESGHWLGFVAGLAVVICVAIVRPNRVSQVMERFWPKHPK